MADEHLNPDRYLRYHKDVYVPDNVRTAAMLFLPPPYTPLTTSEYYDRMARSRRLPSEHIHMPHHSRVRILETTVVKATQVISRVLIRFRWTGKNAKVQKDLCLVLEGDGEIVTGFWLSPEVEHQYDENLYVKLP